MFPFLPLIAEQQPGRPGEGGASPPGKLCGFSGRLMVREPRGCPALSCPFTKESPDSRRSCAFLSIHRAGPCGIWLSCSHRVDPRHCRLHLRCALCLLSGLGCWKDDFFPGLLCVCKVNFEHKSLRNAGAPPIPTLRARSLRGQHSGQMRSLSSPLMNLEILRSFSCSSHWNPIPGH